MTYASYLDTSSQMCLTPYLGSVHAVQDLSFFRRQRDKYLGAFAAHAHQADRRFWVGVGLMPKNLAHRIALGLPSRGSVVYSV